jgi:hypothetical protein
MKRNVGEYKSHLKHEKFGKYLEEHSELILQSSLEYPTC